MVRLGSILTFLVLLLAMSTCASLGVELQQTVIDLHGDTGCAYYYANDCVIGEGYHAADNTGYAFQYHVGSGVLEKFYGSYAISHPDYLSGRGWLYANDRYIFASSDRPYINYRVSITEGGRLAIQDLASYDPDLVVTPYDMGSLFIENAQDCKQGLIVNCRNIDGKKIPFLYDPLSGSLTSYETTQSWSMMSINSKGQAVGTAGPYNFVLRDGSGALKPLDHHPGSYAAHIADNGTVLFIGECTPSVYDITTGTLSDIPSTYPPYTTVYQANDDGSFVGAAGGAYGGYGNPIPCFWTPASQPVPEPSCALVTLTGLISFVFMRRRRK